MFKLFDEDGTGYITFRNLKKICNDLGENLSAKRSSNSDRDSTRDCTQQTICAHSTHALPVAVPLSFCLQYGR